MPDLKKKIWIDQIKSKMYPDTSFLNYTVDYTPLVANDQINLAEAGLDPEVLINNTTYPINTVERTDTPISLDLDLFETENTLVRLPEAAEYSYNKLESVIMGHRNSLRAKTGQKAIHAYAPASNTTKTPVLVTTGANDGTGRLRLKVADILRHKTSYDNLDYLTDKRFLVLCPLHVEDLMLEDFAAFKDIIDLVDGKPKRFAGFNMMQFTKNPIYNISTGAKVAFGAAADSNSVVSSVSFYGDEVMRADGNVEMYSTVKDPKLRATIVGFDKRFLGMPIRQQGIGAIISGKAA